jgi:hypothetical protein
MWRPRWARAGLVLDGGDCAAGIESTIVALREGGWQVLRPGPITAEAIAQVLGEPPARRQPRHRGARPVGQPLRPGKPVRLNADAAREDEFLIGFGALAGISTSLPAAIWPRRRRGFTRRCTPPPRPAAAGWPWPCCPMAASAPRSTTACAAPPPGQAPDQGSHTSLPDPIALTSQVARPFTCTDPLPIMLAFTLPSEAKLARPNP